MAATARRSWQLPTWDRLLIPLPFSRITIVLGEPYTVTPGLDAEQLEHHRLQLEQQLADLVEAAENALDR
jgi:lysophospholipid acyltransferase (LPLAT)-like uncharacterized protein